MRIEKKDNFIVIKKMNKIYFKYYLIDFLPCIFFPIFLSILGINVALLTFLFLGLFYFIEIKKLIVSFFADEEIILKEDKIYINYYGIRKIFQETQILNNKILELKYDNTDKIDLKKIFITNLSNFSCSNYRRMKFIFNNNIYSFGYDLSKNDYDTIKTLILEQRERSNNKYRRKRSSYSKL